MNRLPKPLNVQLVMTLAVGLSFVVATLSLKGADAPVKRAAGGTPERRAVAVKPARVPAVKPGMPVLRESSLLLDRSGTVCRQGGRVVFNAADGRATMVLLENRMLERVETLLTVSATPPRLLVSGRVTEYRKRNYLLLSRVYVDTTSGR